MELHDGLPGVRNAFQSVTLQWGDRRVDESDTELDGIECKLIRRLLWDIAHPVQCDDDNGHDLQHVRAEQQRHLLLEDRGEKRLW